MLVKVDVARCAFVVNIVNVLFTYFQLDVKTMYRIPSSLDIACAVPIKLPHNAKLLESINLSVFNLI